MSVLIRAVLISLGTGLVTILIIKAVLPGRFLSIIQDKSLSQARHVAGESADPLLSEQHFVLEMKLLDLKRSDRSIAYAFIVDTHGKIAAHTFQQSGFPVELKDANRLEAGKKESLRELTADGERILDICLPVMREGQGELHVGTYLSFIEHEVNGVVLMITIIIALTSIISGIVAVMLSGRQFSHLKELGLAIKSFGREDRFQMPLPAGVSSDIEELILLFNRMSEDIRQSAEEREKSRKFLASLIENLSENIMVIRPDYRVLMKNRTPHDPAAENRFCYSISHQRQTPCEGSDTVCPLREVLKTKAPVIVTHKHLQPDGTEHMEEVTASPFLDDKGELLYVIEVCRDVTEKHKLSEMRRELDRRRAQQRKEESISTLAGGLAHDFNNILMGVMGNAELLLMTSNLRQRERELAESIVSSSEKMAHLTGQMLAYAKGGMYEPESMSINSAIISAVKLLEQRPVRNVDVRLNLQEDLWFVQADSQQMQQMMYNLLENAFEAMEAEGGVLEISTRNEPDKAAWTCASFSHDHPEGDYVHISIADNGPGIPEEFIDRIFEPFFSTKFMGRGLGLAAVSGIVQHHGGCITTMKRPSGGTQFDIYFPRVITGPAIEVQPAAADRTPGMHFLIVDDEPQIVSLMENMLHHMGYETVSAGNGTDALALFLKMKDEIGIAILDIQMPGMPGNKLFAELKTLKPDLKVIIASGYDEDEALTGLGPNPADGFLQKPFKAGELKDMINAVLQPH